MIDPTDIPAAEDTSGHTDGAAVTAEGSPHDAGVIESEQVAGGPAPRGRVTSDTAPEAGSAEPVDARSGDDQTPAADGDGDEADAEATARAEAEDQADLERYPESVRDRFKALKPAERRALYEHAETNARAQIEAANARAAELQRAEDERQAQVKRVLDSQGEFIGEKPIKLSDGQGGTFDGPTYNELTAALTTRRGRAELFNRYGLDEDAAEAWKTELDGRRDMLGSSAKLMEDAAWGTLALRFKAGLEAIPEIDANALVAGATGPEDVLARFSAAKDERHAREMAAQKRDYEARIGALTANTEGMKGRVVAAESRRLPTGGRTGSGAAGGSVVDRLIAEAGGPEQFAERAARGEYAGINLTK